MKTLIKQLLVVAGVLALAACPEASLERKLVTEPPESGAALWIEGELDADGQALLEIWGGELGPVFGLSLHLFYDGGALELVDGSLSVEPLLGAEDEEAIYLTTVAAPGDLGLGGVRRSPERGEVDVVTPTQVGALTLRGFGEQETHISLARAMVRRADGAFVPVALSGAEIVVEGGEL